LPFKDNIERAHRSGVTAIVEDGGSIRDRQVMDTAASMGSSWPFAACARVTMKR
jgi:phosphoribosylaminoimidazolecarboxamide formyltransferase / IMP cyclohydrolase